MTELSTYILWRIDGDDFMLTDITGVDPASDTDEIIRIAARREYASVGFTHEEIQAVISVATNPDDPEFRGYEIATIFTGRDVTFYA